MAKTLNLIYSSPKTLSFFAEVKKTKEIVLQFKSEGIINDFGASDETEVGRSNSYAVFPELKTTVDGGEQITLDALRQGLRSRGVVDEFMQNKAMAMLLQSKAGLQFNMGNILNMLLLENRHELLMHSDYDVTFEVQSPNCVKLIFAGTWCSTTSTQEKCLKARVEIDITPERIAIHSFTITQLSKSSEANEAFKFFQKNQMSIWQKMITFLKNYFSSNSRLDIENTAVDKKPWQENTKKIEAPLANDKVSSSETVDFEQRDSSMISRP